MPKLSNRPPKLGQDGNYAVVYIDGEKKRLGKWGSEEARTNYRRFVAEWATIGISAGPHRKKVCLIDELALGFLSWAKDTLGKSDFGNYRTALKTTLEIYSGTPVEQFGPRSLIAVQDLFVQKGYARKYCNKLTGFVRRVFRWGFTRELVPLAVADALKYVQPLLEGKTKAPERPSREEVSDEVVEATLPYLLPTVADMVQVQRLAAMRPGEVCRIRVGDIDQKEEVWFYYPFKHKGTWRKHKRVIVFGKPEQEILKLRMAGKSSGNYVFSPREALEELRERKAARRKSKVQPSQIARRERRAANPKRKVREAYDSNSYRRSITKSICKANEQLPEDQQIPRWTPYQLRHAAITELTEMEGIDVARAVAGQKSIDTTQLYNHADKKIATNAAKKRSNQFGCK